MPHLEIRNLSYIRFRHISSHHSVAVEVIGVFADGVLHHAAPAALVRIIVFRNDQVLELVIEVGHVLGIRQEKVTLIVDPVLPSRLDGLRATLTVAQHQVELLLQVGPRGHGPVQLALNDRPLPFKQGVNPYRRGAAEVSMDALRAALQAGVNRLVVRLG